MLNSNISIWMQNLDAYKQKACQQRQYQVRVLSTSKFPNSRIIMLQSHDVSLSSRSRKFIMTLAVLKQRTNGHDRMPNSRFMLGKLQDDMRPKVRIDRSGQRRSSNFAKELNSSRFVARRIPENMMPRLHELKTRWREIQSLAYPSGVDASQARWLRLVTFYFAGFTGQTSGSHLPTPFARH